MNIDAIKIVKKHPEILTSLRSISGHDNKEKIENYIGVTSGYIKGYLEKTGLVRNSGNAVLIIKFLFEKLFPENDFSDFVRKQYQQGISIFHISGEETEEDALAYGAGILTVFIQENIEKEPRLIQQCDWVSDYLVESGIFIDDPIEE